MSDNVARVYLDGEPLAAFCNLCGISVVPGEEHDCAAGDLRAARRAHEDIERRRLAREAVEVDDELPTDRPLWRKAWDAIWDRRGGIVFALCAGVFGVSFMGLAYLADQYEPQASGPDVAACSQVATQHLAVYGAVNVAAFPECEALSVTQRTAVQAALSAVAEARP